MSSRVVIQSQDSEGIQDPWVQAPQPPGPALWLDVASRCLPSPSPWAWHTGPALHQEARQVPGAFDGPVQLHLSPVSPVGQAADGDVGRSRIPWGEGRDTYSTRKATSSCACVLPRPRLFPFCRDWWCEKGPRPRCVDVTSSV